MLSFRGNDGYSQSIQQSASENGSLNRPRTLQQLGYVHRSKVTWQQKTLHYFTSDHQPSGPVVGLIVVWSHIHWKGSQSPSSLPKVSPLIEFIGE